jgi:mono/diheme cytochrome c family protein
MPSLSSLGMRSPLLLAGLVLAACGGKTEQASPPAAAAAAGSDLTPFQLEHGIGPVTQVVTVGPIDEEMAEQGEKFFEVKCGACHKMTERYVGPPLGDVTTRRSAAFIMNQLLNPEGMYAKHPEAKKLLAEYMTQMPNLGLTQEQARQVVEYLRTQAPGKSGS